LATSAVFSANGEQVISGSSDKHIRVWDAQTGMTINKPLMGHSNRVNAITISSDGKYLASASYDRTIRIWDSTTGKQVGDPFQGHTDVVLSVAFTPDGKHIVSGSHDRTIRRWNVTTGKQLGGPLRGHTDHVQSVVTDGRMIVSGSPDASVRMWDFETGEQLGEPLTVQAKWVWSVAISDARGWVVSGSHDGFVRMWDMQTHALVMELDAKDPVSRVAFSDVTNKMATGLGNGNILIWNLDAIDVQPITLSGVSRWVNSIAFSRDGRFLVSASGESMHVWDVRKGEEVNYYRHMLDD
jgi:WD40 repeat protein